MAIDYTGISSLDTGAHDITYSGNEGPRSPEENREIALSILGDEVGEVASQLWNGMSPPEKSEWRSIEGFIQSEDFKIILMKLQSEQQDRGGIQTASATDPMLQEEYDKYIFEMQEQGLEPMSFEQFREQAVAGMATGGRVGYDMGGNVRQRPHQPSELLVRNTGSGERPKYQPPGGGATSLGSGRDYSGPDPEHDVAPGDTQFTQLGRQDREGGELQWKKV